MSRTWAYKKREVDAAFDGWCRQAQAFAKARLPARVNRERKGGWTAAKEERFLAALAATRDVPLAAIQVGISAGATYYHRRRWPEFAAGWSAALADDETFADAEWVAPLICMLEGEPVPPDLPVQTIGIDDVIRLYGRSLGVRRGRPMR